MVETISLYGGEVILTFDPVEHVYTLDGVRVPNVTSVTDCISIGSKTSMLMAWACKVMGQRIKELWPKDILKHQHGIPVRYDFGDVTKAEFESIIKQAKAAHKEKKQQAAEIGGQVHAWVEAHIKAQLSFGERPPVPTHPQILSGVQAHLAWESQHRVHYILSEQKVYSRRHNVCGTLDIGADVDGVWTLLDGKTSNGFRDEYRLQTSAYAHLLEEETGRHFEDRKCLMWGKENGGLTVVDLGMETADEEFDAFLGALAVFRWEQKMKDAKPKRRKKAV